jgi:hypothetical protein
VLPYDLEEATRDSTHLRRRKIKSMTAGREEP